MRALALAARHSLRSWAVTRQRVPTLRRRFSDHAPNDSYSAGYDDDSLDDGTMPDSRSSKFRLSPGFVDKFRTKAPPFGFNGLGEFVYATRYARVMADGSKEQWYQTVERVVNGTYSMQKRWIDAHDLGWNPRRAQRSAQEMYERIFAMKFLPPGRGLWAMGSPLTEERHVFAALNNCAFVSTAHVREDGPSRPFTFLMDAAMLGVGVGFDTDGAGLHVKGPSSPSRPRPPVLIEDSREGWVDSVRGLLDAHFEGRPLPSYDYTAIRPRGTPIRGFGGTASGHEVLQRLHVDINSILGPLAGKPLTVTAIVDLMNCIGRCIVSGDVRQTAEIAFGDPSSKEYLDLKDYAVNPRRAEWGWTSNNSVYATLGMDYDPAVKRILANGEPGFAWLENMRNFGRMGDPPDFRDKRAKGGNPCLEQTLESYELCCLVETFPHNHDNLDDFKRTLKFAYLYAKTVTLGRTHWPATNRVMLRNRRIGCSLSGVAQFVASRGLHELRQWCDAGYAHIQDYDRRYSEWLTIPRSIKTTCIKPSGTVSLLAGATPGLHYPESRFYLRRVRVGSNNEVVAPLREAGYHVEPAVEDPDRKVVITFPVDAGPGIRTLDSLTLWEQFGLAALLQRHWADNQVSCTVSFDPQKEGAQLSPALDLYQYQLKGVSLLPRVEFGAYAQMPYEAVSEEVFREHVSLWSWLLPAQFRK